MSEKSAEFFLQPLPGKLVVERLEDEPEPGTFVVDDAHREKSVRGRVLAVWDVDLGSHPDDPVLCVKTGDEVYFRKYGPVEVQFRDKNVLLLEQTDVYAVVRAAQSE